MKFYAEDIQGEIHQVGFIYDIEFLGLRVRRGIGPINPVRRSRPHVTCPGTTSAPALAPAPQETPHRPRRPPNSQRHPPSSPSSATLSCAASLSRP